MEIIPYKFMKEPPAEHIKRVHQLINMPTEFVVTEPKYVVPTQARVFNTHLWILDDNKIVGYDTLCQEKGFNGTSYYDELLLVEVWLDCGDDGHADYQLKGWMYVPQSRLNEELQDEYIKYYGLPLCMRWGEDYDKHYEEHRRWRNDEP